MAYDGTIATIPLGSGGLMTDAPHTLIPATNLVRAQNISLYNDVLQKDFGSRQWNQTALPSGIVQFKEIFLNGTEQKIFAVSRYGQIYRFDNPYQSSAVMEANGGGPYFNPNNYVSMVTGGNEEAGRPRKMFFFNGYNKPQVVSLDTSPTSIRASLSKPASDWTGTYQPFGGVIHRGHLFAWGNYNNPHAAYASSVLDHEDFTTTPINFNIYPGESEKLVCMEVFRSQLYAFKYPVGAYVLIDSDPSPQNWYFTKVNDEFGAASPQSAVAVNNDFLVSNNYGSITSLTAALIYGNVMLADVFHTNKTIRYAQENLRPDVIVGRHMVYYPWKRQVLCSFQSYANPYFDTIMVLDYKVPNQPPKIYPVTKDKPNCLGVISDYRRVVRPAYGAEDGFIYQMDSEDRWIGSSDSTTGTPILFEAMTPHIDFGQGNETISEQVKTFDRLEIVYEPTGDYSLYVDVYIDGKFSQTIEFNLSGRSNLNEFPLNQTILDGLVPYSIWQPLKGSGRRIAFRMYNNEVGQDVRLAKLKVYFKFSGQQSKVG